ncbi:hypothetical protein D3C80_1185510 [compost metagenome]
MDNECIVLHIVGKAHSIRMMELQRPAGRLPDPAGQLDAADIIRLGMVGARLGNQHLVTVPQPVNRPGSADQLLQIALMAGKQNGKGGERNIRRRISGGLKEHLGVGYNHTRLTSEAFQCQLQLVLFSNNSYGVALQNVPDGLLLGQDQSALWCRLVNGCNQDNQISRREQVADDPEFVLLSRHCSRQSLSEQINSLLRSSRYRQEPESE